MSGTVTTPAVLEGLAGLLHAQGVATWAGPGAQLVPLPGRPAVALVHTPETPDSVLTLAVTGRPDPAGFQGMPEWHTVVQVRARAPRGDTVGALKALDAVDGVLHQAQDVRLTSPAGGVLVSWSERSGSAPIGPDQSGRAEATASFQLIIKADD